MNLRYTVKKTVALALIITPLFHTYLAIKDIIFILPKISFIGSFASTQTIYQAMLKKAIVISASLLIESFYGFSLLIKPLSATRYIHIILGILLFIISVFVFRISSISHLFPQLPLIPLTWNTRQNKKLAV